MMGKRFSVCPESPGWKPHKDHWWQKSYLAKSYRGQASASFQNEMLNKDPDCAEGATGPIIRPGATVSKVIKEFEGGVRSALSYLGLSALKDLTPENVIFIKTSSSAIVEGTPHGT